MHFVYIIYSQQINQYYIGETENISERLSQHNSGFFTKSFTHKVSDWKLFIAIECQDRLQARNIETHLKMMKSRKYIMDLEKYPEMLIKLKEKYKQRSSSR